MVSLALITLEPSTCFHFITHFVSTLLRAAVLGIRLKHPKLCNPRISLSRDARTASLCLRNSSGVRSSNVFSMTLVCLSSPSR